MRRPSAEVWDPDIPQLGLLDLLLSVPFPAHHYEVGGAGYLLDLVIRVVKSEVCSFSDGPSPAVVCEQDEEEEAEGAKGDEGEDV